MAPLLRPVLTGFYYRRKFMRRTSWKLAKLFSFGLMLISPLGCLAAGKLVEFSRAETPPHGSPPGPGQLYPLYFWQIGRSEDLWDDIAASTEGLPIPQWHEEELNRRLDNEADDQGRPWEQVRSDFLRN